MAVQPFRGTVSDWLVENGWVATVRASAGRFDLREYTTKSPGRYVIADRGSVVRGSGAIYLDGFGRGWATHWNDVEHFAESPAAAFEWWVEQETAAR